LDRIIIADAQQPVFALVYIADKKGYFKDEGLEINYRKFTLGRDALDDVLKGNSDLATVYETPVVNKINSGKDIRIISTLHTSTRNTAIIARKSHGITKAADLIGKRIAVPKGTNAEFFLDIFLTTEGIGLDEVTILNMTDEEALQALESETIDATALYNPYAYKAVQLIKNDAMVFYSDVYTEVSMLAGSTFVDPKNEEKILKLLRALVKAEAYTKQNNDDALRITKERLQRYDTRTIAGIWHLFTMSVKLDNSFVATMERESEFYFGNGTYTGIAPNIRSHVKTEYLKTVDPERVTL
jgi:NitT/TauT family transport system substrate-binding protein